MSQKACPVCRQPMRWFQDHWVCVNIKAHDAAVGTRKGGGGRRVKKKGKGGR